MYYQQTLSHGYFAVINSFYALFCIESIDTVDILTEVSQTSCQCNEFHSYAVQCSEHSLFAYWRIRRLLSTGDYESLASLRFSRFAVFSQLMRLLND